MIDAEAIASTLMFGKPTLSDLCSRYNIELRKNKTIHDVNKALKKAVKNGMGRTEFELSMLEVYVVDVFKARKAPN